ncbi:helix-turn-helix domain-containing protein [Streptomyces decoyicus]|uniref:helix-turn-helix domain-containing protein n=1 Tax=Streptomyces decoyicus TaxID=249567 RepID=UPI0033AFF8A4
MAAPERLPASRPSAQHVVWHWATPQARTILNSGDLGAILRFHRTVHGLNQTELGNLLGYDKTYISALELRKKTMGDVGSLRRVAEQLRLPPHILGVTDPADTDHRAMVQFGQSTVRLAEIARQSGHASEAVAELWPLVARLEARLEDGHAEREVLRLLAHARVGLGVALGNVLPEERLATAAHWTAKSLSIAAHFKDPGFTSYALRMHGNELRKAHIRGAAVDRLRQAAALAPDRETRAAVLPLLARAARTRRCPALRQRDARSRRSDRKRRAHFALQPLRAARDPPARPRQHGARGRRHTAGRPWTWLDDHRRTAMESDRIDHCRPRTAPCGRPGRGDRIAEHRDD